MPLAAKGKQEAAMTAPYDERDLGFFTMGQVAEMLGVQQAFLRRLEAHDLVSPERSSGNQRRYSREDIDRMTEILGLIDEGLNLSGVHRVLALQAEVGRLKQELARRRRS